MPLWLASLLFYLYIWALCALIRLISRLFVEDKARLLCEFAAVIQVCAPMFDVDLVYGEYGFWGVWVLILLWEVLSWETLGDAEGSPLCFVQEGFLRSAPPLKEMKYLFWAQLAGGALCFLPVYAFWWMGLHPAHAEAYVAPDEGPCVADLSVPLIWGALIEGGAVFAYRWTELKLDALKFNYHLAALTSSTLVATCTAIGLDWTGMYCNPIEAFALIFNCDGLSWSAHFGVYWLAPFAGAYAAQLHAVTS